MADNNINDQDQSTAPELVAKEWPSSSASSPDPSPNSSPNFGTLNTNQTPFKVVVSMSDCVATFERMIPKYSGEDTEIISCDSWAKKATGWITRLMGSIDEGIAVSLLLSRLTGAAEAVTVNRNYYSPTALLFDLNDAFPKIAFQWRLIKRLETGEAVQGLTRLTAITTLTQMLEEISDATGGSIAIAKAARGMFPSLWAQLHINPIRASTEDMRGALKELHRMVDADERITPQLYGKAKTSTTPQSLTPNAPGILTKNQRRRGKDKMRIQELEQQLRAATSGTTNNNGNLASPANTASAQVAGRPEAHQLGKRPSGYRNTYAIGCTLVNKQPTKQSSRKHDSRKRTHWTRLDETQIGGRPVDAVVGQGAQVSLITNEAAEKLGVNVNTTFRPELKSPWGHAYTSYGVASARVSLADGPKRWMRLVVINESVDWDLLVGAKNLEELGVELMTPAMKKQLEAKVKQAAQETVRLASNREAIEEIAAPTDEDYADLKDNENSMKYNSMDESIELLQEG